MVKHLQIKVILLLTGFMTGCGNDSPANHNKVLDKHKPLWIQELPGKSGVYNDGLIGFPVYKDQVFFHSTYDMSDYEEDNRIHALDMNTGAIQWTFPQTYKSMEPMFFWGYPYLHENNMVMKMSKFQKNSKVDRIICINPENREVRWKINIPEQFSYYASRDISGVGNKIWFIQQGCKTGRIYEAGLLNGDTACIHEAYNDNTAEKVEISSNNQVLITSGAEPKLVFATTISAINDDMNFRSYLNILNLKTRKVEKKLLIEGDSAYSINSIKVHGNKIFVCRGKTVQCYDFVADKTDWIQNISLKDSYASVSMLYQDEVIFMWGTGGYYAFNASNGSLLYRGNIGCGNADVFNGIVYVTGQDGKLHLIDIKSGQQISEISAPVNPKGDRYFLTGSKPQIHSDKLYMFTEFYAVCYKVTELFKEHIP